MLDSGEFTYRECISAKASAKPSIGAVFRIIRMRELLLSSGPKGRRFKSCHLDQSLSGNVLSWQAFFCALHKKSGEFRISPFSLRNGLRRILSDIVGF